MDLVEPLKRPEGKTLEVKRELSAPDGALRTVASAGSSTAPRSGPGTQDPKRRYNRAE